MNSIKVFITNFLQYLRQRGGLTDVIQNYMVYSKYKGLHKYAPKMALIKASFDKIFTF